MLGSCPGGGAGAGAGCGSGSGGGSGASPGKAEHLMDLLRSKPRFHEALEAPRERTDIAAYPLREPNGNFLFQLLGTAPPLSAWASGSMVLPNRCL